MPYASEPKNEEEKAAAVLQTQQDIEDCPELFTDEEKVTNKLLMKKYYGD